MDVSLLTIERFRTWLREQAPRSIVGQAGMIFRCPLACWIAASSGRSCKVLQKVYHCPASSPARHLPAWAVDFSLLLDYGYLTTSRGRLMKHRPVTREECLLLLKQVS